VLDHALHEIAPVIGDAQPALFRPLPHDLDARSRELRICDDADECLLVKRTVLSGRGVAAALALTAPKVDLIASSICCGSTSPTAITAIRSGRYHVS